MKKKSVLFYSSVRTKKMFSIQSYYRNDIQIFRDLEYDVHLSKSCWDFILFWRYSTAYIYFYRYGFFAALFAKLFFKKVYFTGGIDYLDANFATKRQRMVQAIFFRLCNAFSDKSFLVSSSDVRNVSSLYRNVLPSNCELCFHVIDVERFVYTSDIVKRPNQFLLVAWMQNIDNVFRKGIDKAVKVFFEVHKLHPESTFIIAGTQGGGSEYVMKLVDELGLKDCITYLGAISEEYKILLMKQSRFYFMLSTYEGFGIAAIESLAAGCCLIHSGRGGLMDAAGSHGVIVDISDLDGIVRKCLQLYESPIDFEEIKGSIAFVRERFSYSKRLEAIQSVVNK